MSAISKLIRKRGGLKHKLTNFSNFIEKTESDYTGGTAIDQKIIFDVTNRLKSFESLLPEFENIQEEIEIACEEKDLEEQYAERNSFSNSYWDALATAKLLISKLEPASPAIDNKMADSANPLQNVKLPTINLPCFKGDINKWLEFKDTFVSLINDSQSLSEIMKFHYLKASLQGEPLKIVQALEFSADNYKIAWEALCNRFDSKRLLVFNHIRSLFNLESIHRESASSLRSLIDGVFEHLKCLNMLGEPTNTWDSILIYLIWTKLDRTTAREWERLRTADKKVPTFTEFQSFLQSRAEFLETLENSHVNKREKEARPSKVALFSSNSKGACNYCSKANHFIYNCPDFLKLSVKDRFEKVKQLKLCQNCLCTNKHDVKSCRSGSCRKCKQRHSSLLHFDNNDSQNISEIVSNNDPQPSTSETSINLLNTLSKHVLLSTASIYVLDSKGNKRVCKAILDSGSQSNFISKRLCDALHLKQDKSTIAVTSINNVTSPINKRCNVTIESRVSDFKTSISCFIVSEIAELTFDKLNVDSWSIPSNIQLADPLFNEGSKIDLLIGAGLFWGLLSKGKIQLGKNKPILQNTLLGWLVAGTITNDVSHTHCYFSKEVNLEYLELKNELKKFWELEECSYPLKECPENVMCDKHFEDTHYRNSEGRFVVRIPLKHPPCSLGDSKTNAIKRLLSLERRLQKSPSLLSQYAEFLQQYEELGHMSKVTAENDKDPFYYLPHHCVVRESSLTTKLRVVFNGSAASSSGISLNDIQYVGPQLLNDLVSILLRFRLHNVVVAADIEKMFRQISVHPDDRSLQRIVWRNDLQNLISTFELNTVVYGTASAPYLAMRCLKQLASDCRSEYPIASDIIYNDFYMDDLITGFSSSEEAISVCTQISNILKSACLPLRKWVSNKPGVVDHFKEASDNVSVLRFGENDSVKTLGIQWICNTDHLTYHVNNCPQLPCTKRSILSTIAKLYDPLGLISACTIIAKIIIQKLWILKADWDEDVPDELKISWMRFNHSLSRLNELRIPRQIACVSPLLYQLHGFSDASQNAYCACVYLRTVNADSSIYTQLVSAKTKVAPLKSLTIPRLELCGAVLLAKLMNQVVKSLSIETICYYWSDSKIVLSWLKLHPRNLQVFVSNRVSEIQSISNINNWNYVPTKENPADLGSRGVYPENILSANIWWKGPHWLSDRENCWPSFQPFINVNDLPETKQTTLICATQSEPLYIFEKFSTLTRLKRVVAYCLRFTFNAKRANAVKLKGTLSVEELNASINVLLRLSQLDSFKNELKQLENTIELNKNNRLLSLAPFIDENRLIRVGGRLKNSDLEFACKHPILLDSKHPLTKLIMLHEHSNLLHAGPQMLLASVRQAYWPTSGMSLAKKIVKNCLTCFKHKPKQNFNLMGDLPKERVTVAVPFSITGVDYAGPFLIKDRKGRGCKLTKGYICLFICFSVKAVHLELVSDLTTESFLASFRRFISRRGFPSEIWSDNATNFTGAARSLKELKDLLKTNKDAIADYFAVQNIKWKFIPASSPHFGGLWESNIKSVKRHLFKVINNTHLTYDEFYTVIVQIEAILNSRPLFPMSSDPNDLTPLTPSHFLIGKPLITVPDPNLLDTPIGRLSRFQLIQQLRQSFWKRWSRDYLTYLQRRNKWMKKSPLLTPGTMVLLKDDHLPPSQWALGRIVECYPGLDGVVRVVDIKTCKGIYKRAITKVCPLPMDTECSD